MTAIDQKVILRALSWLWDHGNRQRFGGDMTKWSLWHKRPHNPISRHKVATEMKIEEERTEWKQNKWHETKKIRPKNKKDKQDPMKYIQSSNRSIKDKKTTNHDYQRQSDNGKNLGKSLKSSDLPKGLGVTRLELYLGREPREV